MRTSGAGCEFPALTVGRPKQAKRAARSREDAGRPLQVTGAASVGAAGALLTARATRPGLGGLGSRGCAARVVRAASLIAARRTRPAAPRVAAVLAAPRATVRTALLATG